MKLNLEVIENNANILISNKYNNDDIVELKISIFDKLITKNEIKPLSRKFFYDLTEFNKEKYKNFINGVFKHHFQEYYEGGGIIIKGKWSNLNKVNTNKQVLSYTVNFLNKFILDKIAKVDNDNFMDFLEILDKHNSIYYNSTFMTGALLIIKNLEAFDISMSDAIKAFLESKGANVTKMGGTGNKEDMLKGLDIEFVTAKGNKVKSQVKNYSYIEKDDDGGYVIKGVALTAKYPLIDKFIFYKASKGKLISIAIFANNKNVIVGNGYYKFPKENLEYFKKLD